MFVIEIGIASSFCIFFTLLFISFQLCWVFVAGHRLLSSCGAPASRCCGFSRCRAGVLSTRASVVVVHGLSCSEHVGPSHAEGGTRALSFARGFSAAGPPGQPHAFFPWVVTELWALGCTRLRKGTGFPSAPPHSVKQNTHTRACLFLESSITCCDTI